MPDGIEFVFTTFVVFSFTFVINLLNLPFAFANWLQILGCLEIGMCIQYVLYHIYFFFSVCSFQCTIIVTVFNQSLHTKFNLISNHWLNQYLYKHPLDGLFLLIRQPPALPCRLQHSTIGRLSLNLRVRDVYGCFP